MMEFFAKIVSGEQALTICENGLIIDMPQGPGETMF